MASIREKTRKDGTLFYEIRVWRDDNKKPISKSWTPPEGWSSKSVQRELQKVSAEFERQVKNGEIVSKTEQKEREAEAKAELAKLKTVRGYIEEIYLPAKTAIFSENSRASYQMFIDKHILPFIGDLLMKDVTSAIITKRLLDYQTEGKGHSHASCVKLYNILNGIFQMAFFDDTVIINPMLKVKRPVQKKDDKKESEADKALTADELYHVVQCLENEPIKWRTYIQLAIDTGARRGEICGLKWSDIDMKNNSVTICRNVGYTPDKGIFINNPKNGKTRKIDIGDDSVALLRLLKKEQGKKCISEYVFTQDGEATVMHPDSPTRYYRKFGKKYSIENFHPHLLRHTSASVAITHGADIVSVSERLGHSDTAVTLRMYAHANEESIRRAGQTVRDALKKASGEAK